MNSDNRRVTEEQAKQSWDNLWDHLRAKKDRPVRSGIGYVIEHSFMEVTPVGEPRPATEQPRDGEVGETLPKNK